MDIERFIKMDLTNKILTWLGGLDKLEKGYKLYLSNKRRYYIESLGKYYLVVYDYKTDEMVEDWGYCDKQKFEKYLRNFIRDYKIKKASMY